MGRRKNSGISFRDALDMVPDDMPDGAAFAMAHEMAGLEYGEGFDELAEEAQAMDSRAEGWLEEIVEAFNEYEPVTLIEQFNTGYHIKVQGRFNFYQPREKWYDSVTNEKGQGLDSFVAYVKRKMDALGRAGFTQPVKKKGTFKW